MLPNSQVYVSPPRTFLTGGGQLNLSKDSPDDWIVEGYNNSTVYECVETVDIEAVAQQIQHLHTQHSTEQKTEKQKMATTLEAFVEDRVFYVPTTDMYYVYNDETYLWEHINLDHLTDMCLKEFKEKNWSFSTTQNILKSKRCLVSTKYSTIRHLFSQNNVIPFQNGCWNFENKTFEKGLKKEQYLCSTLQLDYTPLQNGFDNINKVAPTICKWLRDRVDGSEILTNVLSAVMFACVLRLKNLERFLFLTGHSATGKSTFFRLLTKLVPEESVYTVSADDFACDFGLQDLAEGPPKDLVLFHDIGSTITKAFIDILRTLVSSEGETTYKRVRRKHQRTGFLQFDGIICAASNMSPFTGVQAQGIVDRRLLLVPFLKRVNPTDTKEFNIMFPEDEIKNIILLASQVNPQELRAFLLGVRNHPEMRQIILEHYADNDDESTLLQRFVTERIQYSPGDFVPYGLRQRIAGSLYFEFEKWKQRQDPELLQKFTNKKPIQLKQTLLSYIHMNYPEWPKVEDRRRVVHIGEGEVSKGQMLGITNIVCQRVTKRPDQMLNKEENFDVSKFRQSPWWIETSPEPSSEPETSPEPETSTSPEPATSPEPSSELSSKLSSEPETSPLVGSLASGTFEEFLQCATAQVSNSTLDLPNAQRIRTQLLRCGTESYYQGELSTEQHNTVLLTNPYGESLVKITALRNMFANNDTVALDTEFNLAENNNPHKSELFYIQVCGAQEKVSPVFIIGQAYFPIFKELFLEWLKQPTSLMVGFYLMADLTILTTSLKVPPNIFEGKVWDFYLFFKFLSPKLEEHSLKAWAFRICSLELDKSAQKTDWSTATLTKNLLNYMALDVIVLLKFVNYLPELEEYSWRNTWCDVHHDPIITSYQLDQVLLPVYLEMTLRGIFVDNTMLDTNLEHQETQLCNTLKSLGCTLELLRSASQLEAFLAQSHIPGMEVCLELWPRTPKSQQLTLGKDALLKFVFTEEVSPECFQWFSNYFEFKHDLSEFTSSQQLKKYTSESGLLFPSWDIFGAATGRVITRQPALNSTPRAGLFRHMFKAPEHHYFLIFDYRTIELVIMAVMSEEPTMLQILSENKDLHIFLASQVLERPYEELMALKSTKPAEYKEIRTAMKAVNFGLLYGMGPDTLWDKLLAQGIKYTKDYVKYIHKVWTNTFSGVRKYKHFCRHKIQEVAPSAPYIPDSQNVITSLRGRVTRRAKAVTSTYNFPIQATCADILKTVLRLFYLAKRQGFIDGKVFIVITAHDEIVFQCPKHNTEQTKQQVNQLLLETANTILQSQQSTLKCEVEIGVGDSWADKP